MSYPTDYRGWLAKLVAFKPVSRDSNLPLIHYVRDYLQTVGIEAVLVHNPERTKANLWATLPGEDGATKGGLVLSGHTDVVPVDGQKWSTDPFVTVEKDGKIYGRGTCDMLGFIAIVLSLTPHFLKMKRAKPIHYAFSFDEEFGCLGVPFLLDYLEKHQFTADACVVGEPTDMKVTTGNKGAFAWTVDVHGKPIHTSLALMNTSCNAIEHAAKIIVKVRETALDIRENDEQQEDYSCPFSTMSTVTISGGIATNIVPELCSFRFAMRVTNREVAKGVQEKIQQYIDADVLPGMKKEYPNAKIDFLCVSESIPFEAKESAPVTQHARRLVKDTEVHKMGALTEAGYFQKRLSIPTVILGPGSLEHCAHKPDEFVETSEMDMCYKVLIDLAELISGNGSTHRL
ncbi:acetylornithine deacetylase [Angomonas deanei]|nr:acetylornithine deacetylase [Angomonas deanei]EPY38050.1 acetylornithine deacetylase [Angomonas deanei]|eukprot:EPY36922.1 acetylornithine deacetylase [Angomonas deanei]